MRAFVFGATHIIARSPALSSELLIGVPSAFDTNIYTTHKHTHTHIRVLRNTPAPFQTPSNVHQEKLQSVGFVTASTKTSLREGRLGEMEKRRERRRRRGAASSVSSEIGVTGVTGALFLC